MTSDSRNVFPNLTVFPPLPELPTQKERNKKWGAPPEPLLQTEQGPPLNPKVTARKRKKPNPQPQTKTKKIHKQNVTPGIKEKGRERKKEGREKKAAPLSQMRANTVPKNGETGRKRGERERGEIHGIWGCECVCVCERERKRHRERGRERESESEISKIVQDQPGKIIDTRPKFNTNYSIKVKEKTYFPFPLAVPTGSSPLFFVLLYLLNS